MEVINMQVYNFDKDKLNNLLKENDIPLNDSRKKSKFFETYFEWDMYAKLYTEGEYSVRDICRELNLGYDTVRANLLKKGVTMKPFKHIGSYTFNNIFYPMTPEGAYIMGWLYSDGYVTNNRLGITLSSKDFEHLEYLAGIMSNKPVKCSGNKAEFNFFDTKLVNNLNRDFNLIPNKSHTDLKIDLNKFKPYIPYLILGLLEGDGSISKSKLTFGMLLSSSMWHSIREELEGKVNLTKSRIYKVNEYGLLNIVFSGVSYLEFLYYIYSNTSKVIPLNRKCANFLNQLERSANGITSPYKQLAVSIRDSLNSTHLMR